MITCKTIENEWQEQEEWLDTHPHERVNWNS